MAPPPAALEYARRLAQRDVSANVLLRAYRLGHREALKQVLEEIRQSNLPPKLSLDVYEVIASVSFNYIDWVSQQVVTAYEVERERWLENRNNLRTLRVRELLAGDELDVDATSVAIRYPLRRTHVAVITWTQASDDDEIVSMEPFVGRLARSAGAEEGPLYVPFDDVTAWAWIPLPASAAADAVSQIRMCAEAAADDAPRVAVGEPLAGVDGFRRSHRQARAVCHIATTFGAPPRRIVTAGDPGLAVAALVGTDVDAAAEWVGGVLGPLACATDNDDRLRETLRVFLGAGSSYKAAADELHLHFNSVKYRVQRAVERRGRPIDTDRLDVEVALLLCHHVGTAVLH
jgi:DNA-binding PucR family transcriptional regulator